MGFGDTGVLSYKANLLIGPIYSYDIMIDPIAYPNAKVLIGLDSWQAVLWVVGLQIDSVASRPFT